jgi:CRP-like cAMP-binding protein
MIVGILVPGDSIGLRHREHPAALTSTAALCPCRLLNAAPLQRALASRDNAYSALSRAQRVIDTLEDAHTLAHIVRLGRMSAPERIAHLLLELHWRLDAVGLAPNHTFCLPLTYDSLADTVGLSVVHVNRTLQTLRRDGLIELRQGRVRLLDLDAMRTACDFRPTLPAPLSRDLRAASAPH